MVGSIIAILSNKSQIVEAIRKQLVLNNPVGDRKLRCLNNQIIFDRFDWMHTLRNLKGSDRMLRLGSSHTHTREMDLDDIFLSRLKLLIIMGKAYLNGFPLGECRRQAMLENARHIEMESIDLGGLIGPSCPNGSASTGIMKFDHVFFQRAKLLAVMIKAVAKGFPMGEHRKNAMQENLDIICQMLTFNSPAEMAFLKVA
jgi:hypothetical protein